MEKWYDNIVRLLTRLFPNRRKVCKKIDNLGKVHLDHAGAIQKIAKPPTSMFDWGTTKKNNIFDRWLSLVEDVYI